MLQTKYQLIYHVLNSVQLLKEEQEKKSEEARLKAEQEKASHFDVIKLKCISITHLYLVRRG
jgi:hypothetical protein